MPLIQFKDVGINTDQVTHWFVVKTIGTHEAPNVKVVRVCFIHEEFFLDLIGDDAVAFLNWAVMGLLQMSGAGTSAHRNLQALCVDSVAILQQKKLEVAPVEELDEQS